MRNKIESCDSEGISTIGHTDLWANRRGDSARISRVPGYTFTLGS